MKKALITGAATGLRYGTALQRAEKEFEVIAAVEIYAQVQPLKHDFVARGLKVRVQRLDVTVEGDCRKALAWLRTQYSWDQHASRI